MIFVEKEGEKFALGTLDAERCAHFSLDIHLATDAISLSHSGKGEVFITGYEAISVAGEDEEGGALPDLAGLMRLQGQGSDEGGRGVEGAWGGARLHCGLPCGVR